MAADLPCNDGSCMKCHASPPETEVVPCRTCATPWHVPCLSAPPESLATLAEWVCPDCSDVGDGAAAGGGGGGGAASDLVAAIREIEADPALTEQEKARRRQQLLCGAALGEEEEDEMGKAEEVDDVLDMLDHFNCSFCIKLPDRPVTTPCGHNFCLKCFEKWGKKTCPKCRAEIPATMASQPRINASLVVAIRMAKAAKFAKSSGPVHVHNFINNENRPEKAFTTERAKRAGNANAASGQIFVTIPSDHFGPILAENDPKRHQGVLVGESWEDRMECRQWGAHFPHVAGIAGQSDVGAQSVALSGGYEDDEDHGDWFLYTGSGGRDLSGNKRTNKCQSFDQVFTKSNEALRVSCKKGYPVRVVRSHKEKRSSYAPDSGVRYDGIYRIEKCWRKDGKQGHKVCRYLFVRCDNEPAPWTSDEHGDLPRPLPSIKELKKAIDITERKESPAWDHDKEHGWKWMKSAPISKKPVINSVPCEGRTVINAQRKSLKERLLKEFCCLKCQKVMVDPVTTPCTHNFCKSCLLDSYADKAFVLERTREGGRSLRAMKIVKKCPKCPTDISDFLQNPQINTAMKAMIETCQQNVEADSPEEVTGEGSDAGEKSSGEECSTPPESPSGKKRKIAVDNELAAKKSKKSEEVDGADQEMINMDGLATEDLKPLVATIVASPGEESPSNSLNVPDEEHTQ